MDQLTIVDINNILSIINRTSITGEEADTITALKAKLNGMKAGAVDAAVGIATKTQATDAQHVAVATPKAKKN